MGGGKRSHGRPGNNLGKALQGARDKHAQGRVKINMQKLIVR